MYFAAAGQNADGFEKVVLDGILQQIAARTGLEHFAHIDGILVHAEGEDAGMRQRGGESPRGFDAVQFGHRNIHDDDVWRGFLRQLQNVASIARFADDLHIGLLREDSAKTLADYGVIVSQQDSDGVHAFLSDPSGRLPRVAGFSPPT